MIPSYNSTYNLDYFLFNLLAIYSFMEEEVNTDKRFCKIKLCVFFTS